MAAGIFGVIIAFVFTKPIAKALHRLAAAAEDANVLARSAHSLRADALKEERDDISTEIDRSGDRLYAAMRKMVGEATARLGRDLHVIGDAVDGVARAAGVHPDGVWPSPLETPDPRPRAEPVGEATAHPAQVSIDVDEGLTATFPAIVADPHYTQGEQEPAEHRGGDDTSGLVLRVQPQTDPAIQPPMVDNSLRHLPRPGLFLPNGRMVDPNTHEGRIYLDYRGWLVPSEGSRDFAPLPQGFDPDDALRGGRRMFWEILGQLVGHTDLWEPYPRVRGLLWYHHARALFMAQFGFAPSWDILHEFPRLLTHSDGFRAWAEQNGMQVPAKRVH